MYRVLEHSEQRQNKAQSYLQRMLDEAEKASISQQTTPHSVVSV